MLALQVARIRVTILTRDLTDQLMITKIQSRHGKIWDVSTRKRVGCRPESFPRVRPRVNLLINDNYCVNFLFPSRLTGSREGLKRRTLTPCTQTIDSHLNVKPLVKPVVSAPGLPQRKGISPGLAECYPQTDCKLKFVQSVSCVTQLSCVRSVANAMNVVSNLPVGARAYRQKRSRAGTKSEIPGFLQPAIFSPKTKQQMETYTGSEQTQSFPQGGKIQDGDTGNHQNLPSDRGMGNLDRLQGCLLPYSHTGTVQEIPEISRPGTDIPIQSTAFRSVHSTLGVHYDSIGGETDGHSQGYKNPPVPR